MYSWKTHRCNSITDEVPLAHLNLSRVYVCYGNQSSFATICYFRKNSWPSCRFMTRWPLCATQCNCKGNSSRHPMCVVSVCAKLIIILVRALAASLGDLRKRYKTKEQLRSRTSYNLKGDWRRTIPTTRWDYKVLSGPWACSDMFGPEIIFEYCWCNRSSLRLCNVFPLFAFANRFSISYY